MEYTFNDFYDLASDDVMDKLQNEYVNETEMTLANFYYSNIKYWSSLINIHK